jgi:hypothetical protein
MAIDRIPGVGPTNADIATAVAAPSAATIASAVAAPSAATIASAVAAPSASTIATAVAAAVPTSANITSIVQSNAGSPFGGSWTLISSQSPTSGNTVTFSSLSGYKKYRIYFKTYNGNTPQKTYARINGVTSGYVYNHFINKNGNTTAGAGSGTDEVSIDMLAPDQATTGFLVTGYIDFDQAASSQWKTVEYNLSTYLNSTGGPGAVFGKGYSRDTAAITSLSIYTNGSFPANTTIVLFGGN